MVLLIKKIQFGTARIGNKQLITKLYFSVRKILSTEFEKPNKTGTGVVTLSD
jgi:hypothetical protein